MSTNYIHTSFTNAPKNVILTIGAYLSSSDRHELARSKDNARYITALNVIQAGSNVQRGVYAHYFTAIPLTLESAAKELIDKARTIPQDKALALFNTATAVDDYRVAICVIPRLFTKKESYLQMFIQFISTPNFSTPIATQLLFASMDGQNNLHILEELAGYYHSHKTTPEMRLALYQALTASHLLDYGVSQVEDKRIKQMIWEIFNAAEAWNPSEFSTIPSESSPMQRFFDYVATPDFSIPTACTVLKDCDKNFDCCLLEDLARNYFQLPERTPAIKLGLYRVLDSLDWLEEPLTSDDEKNRQVRQMVWELYEAGNPSESSANPSPNPAPQVALSQ